MVGSCGCRPNVEPGNPTFVRPVRIGDCPVMNAARPAVQLCCPYQSVKSAPSRATRSMLGGRYPIMPLLFALILTQPMSSPQIMRMFGLSAISTPFRIFLGLAPWHRLLHQIPTRWTGGGRAHRPQAIAAPESNHNESLSVEPKGVSLAASLVSTT